MSGIDDVGGARRDALVERLIEGAIGALELYSVHLGWRLGLYRALAQGDALSAGELAERASIDARYAREWLEQQAVAGLVEVDDAAAPEERRRFSLPPEHAQVLADADSDVYVTPVAPMLVGIAGALPEVVEAYRSGDGVPYARFGSDFRQGQAAFNRPVFMHEMANWLAACPGMDARLRAERAPRVADLGCGEGASALAIAAAYPAARVDGFDLDEASIAAARDAAAEQGLGDRVRFARRDAADLADEGPYDVVCVFEALHDMARPVEALAAARAALAPGGGVLVVDERVAESFTAPGSPVERMMYGWSVSHCLPSSRDEQPSAALGTALRVDTVRRLAAEAGFAEAAVLPVENDFFRLYWLES